MICITHYEWSEEQRQFFLFPFIINMVVSVFMIISGYVYSISFEKNKIAHMEDAYSIQFLIPKLLRYIIPYTFVTVWMILDPHVPKGINSIFDAVRWYINGTNGKGGYYFPVMVQFVFVFPAIYFIIKLKGRWGGFICFVISAIYELLIWSYEIPTVSYRLLVLRYILVIATGVLAWNGYKMKLWLAILCTAIGGIFIAAIDYWDYHTVILNYDWADRNFIASLMVIPPMVWVLQNVKIRCLPIEIVGRASYNILLVQMVYYLGYFNLLKDKIPTWQGHMIAGVLISVVVGVIFYYIETPITRGVVRFTSSLIESRSSQITPMQ